MLISATLRSFNWHLPDETLKDDGTDVPLERQVVPSGLCRGRLRERGLSALIRQVHDEAVRRRGFRFQSVLRALREKSARFVSQLPVAQYSVGQVLEQLSHGRFRTETTRGDGMKANAKTLPGATAYRV
jgi:hypothetical protein